MEANKIDWSKAPKSATHYAPSHGHFSEVWIRELTSKSYEFNTVSGHGLWTDSEDITKNELDGIVERPRSSPINVKEFGAITESKPVFTQEMFDAGTLPSVGMEFLVGDGVEYDSRTIDFKNKIVRVIGLSKLDDRTVLTFNHPTIGIGCGIFFESWVKPITPPDTRTDEEKAIDNLVYFFNNHKGSPEHRANELFKQIRINKFHGVTWSKS